MRWIWSRGRSRSTTSRSSSGGHVAYTLASPDPVVVGDMASEQRFEVSPQLQDAGVRSSLSVGIPSAGDAPFGVIGAHAAEPRSFTDGDVALVQGVAAIVGGAIANQRRALDVHDGVLQSLVVAHYSLGAGDVSAAAEAIRAAHEEARALFEGGGEPPRSVWAPKALTIDAFGGHAVLVAPRD
jgi:GAF domain-containing protein